MDNNTRGDPQFPDGLDDVIPGTELLVNGTHHSHLKQRHRKDLVLIPQPSDDPHDPLNFTTTWKLLIMTIQFAYTLVSVTAALSVAPMFGLIGATFPVTQTKLNLLSGVSILGQAYANFLIVPYSNIFGRRQACLTCAVLIVLTEVWQALAGSYRSLLVARALNGLVTAISESVMVQVTNDLFFAHERGTWMGLYFATYFIGVFMGAIIAGNFGERYGWRSFFWLSVAMSSFNLVTLLLGFPGTKYKRKVARANPQSASVIQSENGDEQASSDKEVHVSATPEMEPTSYVGRGRPSKSQFALWHSPDSSWKSHILHDLLAPFRISLYPIIIWAAFVVGGTININLFSVLTESEVLSAPPYNWTPSSMGFANFASTIGGILGLLTAGPFSDFVVRRAAKKNNGVREAEMRLPALIPYTLLMTLGVTLGGLAYQHHWPWPVILVFGYAGAGLSVTSIPTIVVAYAVDCYRPMGGEIMVVATVAKNTCGYGMSYWLPMLAERHGLLTPAMVQYSCSIGPLVLGIPVYFFGKKLRIATRNSCVHQRLDEH